MSHVLGPALNPIESPSPHSPLPPPVPSAPLFLAQESDPITQAQLGFEMQAKAAAEVVCVLSLRLITFQHVRLSVFVCLLHVRVRVRVRVCACVCD